MGSKILLADDSITIQKVVNLTFVDEGIDVITVSNGEMAQRRLAEVNPDLVLADIFMPGKNGYELCQFVKDSPEFKNVPVVLLVGAFEPFDQAEARRVKADGHLTKPFESRTLVETVRNLIQNSKARRPTRPLPPPPVPEPEPMPFSDLGDFGAGSGSASPFDFTAQSEVGSAGLPEPERPWMPSPTESLEFGGLDETFVSEEPASATEEPAIKFDLGNAVQSPLTDIPVESQAPVAVIATVAGEANDIAFQAATPVEPVMAAEESTLHAHRPFDSTGFDYSVSQPAPAPQPAPGSGDFDFQTFDAPPQVSEAPAVDTRGFDLSVAPVTEAASTQPAFGESRPVESSTDVEVNQPSRSGWETVEPSALVSESEPATQEFALYEESQAQVVAHEPVQEAVIAVSQSHAETQHAPEIATTRAYEAPDAYAGSASFGADDEPLGDLLDSEDQEPAVEYGHYAATEAVEPGAAVAEAGHVSGFEFSAPSPVDEHPSAEVGSPPRQVLVPGSVAHEAATEWTHAESVPVEHEVASISSAQAREEASHARDFAYSVPEAQEPKPESDFEIQQAEASYEPAQSEPVQHGEFFSSSFPSRDRLKFTSSQMWNDGQTEEIAAAPEVPHEQESEPGQPPVESTSHYEAAPSVTASPEPLEETGFEFSQLIEEIDELETVHEPEPAKSAEPVAEHVIASNGGSTFVEPAPLAESVTYLEAAHLAEPTAFVDPASFVEAEEPVEPAESVEPAVLAEPEALAPAPAHSPELTEAGQTVAPPPAIGPELTNGNVAAALSPAVIEQIVRTVMKEMSDAVVREIAWEVVPDCVERVVERLSREGLTKRI